MLRQNAHLVDKRRNSQIEMYSLYIFVFTFDFDFQT